MIHFNASVTFLLHVLENVIKYHKGDFVGHFSAKSRFWVVFQVFKFFVNSIELSNDLTHPKLDYPS